MLALLALATGARRAWVAALMFSAAASPTLAQGPSPQGAEFQVNTTTASEQRNASVAVDDDGNFVVVWESFGQDGSGSGIYAQRYTAPGAPVGAEFRVNTTTLGFQSRPSVALDADGDVVVAWTSLDEDGAQADCYAQRYAASGEPVGSEFRVNTTTTGFQSNPSVAVDDDGDFVVAWAGGNPGGTDYEVYAQRYAASGAPIGPEFRVNATTSRRQWDPSVAVDDDGDFVVAWESEGQDGPGTGVYAQRYAASGGPVGGEFRVNSTTAGDQRLPSVSLDGDGDFVVAWDSFNQNGLNINEVYAQRYSQSGAPVGGEFRVDAPMTRPQQYPAVTVDGDGDLVVAWVSFEAGSSTNVYAQQFASSGSPVGAGFRVNTTTTGFQSNPSVAVDGNGDFVVAWESGGQDGSGGGVFAQRYAGSTVASEPAPPGGPALSVIPSPVGPSGGRVRYEVAEAGHVRMAVVDVLGREVAVLAEGVRPAGVHDVALAADLLAPGLYVVRLTAGSETAALRVTVAR